ncbi:hypothetical protein [Achromobacter ruhlandii]|uniref:hypothetical protein n=1 Tax=Achromobacter ruhlandii TaxID=72557 RepID=UPI0022B8E4E7|nr:hypothetical protein [Achromobacter ruhlandii]MCZ8398399.1 hypothetical protein [Achromobacter ruhlandii]
MAASALAAAAAPWAATSAAGGAGVGVDGRGGVADGGVGRQGAGRGGGGRGRAGFGTGGFGAVGVIGRVGRGDRLGAVAGARRGRAVRAVHHGSGRARRGAGGGRGAAAVLERAGGLPEFAGQLAQFAQDGLGGGRAQEHQHLLERVDALLDLRDAGARQILARLGRFGGHLEGGLACLGGAFQGLVAEDHADRDGFFRGLRGVAVLCRVGVAPDGGARVVARGGGRRKEGIGEQGLHGRFR